MRCCPHTESESQPVSWGEVGSAHADSVAHMRTTEFIHCGLQGADQL